MARKRSRKESCLKEEREDWGSVRPGGGISMRGYEEGRMRTYILSDCRRIGDAVRCRGIYRGVMWKSALTPLWGIVMIIVGTGDWEM